MFKILRFITIGLYFALVFLLAIIICIIRPFNKNNVYVAGRLIAYWGFAILGIKFEKRGFDKYDSIGPAVYLSNHQNNVDIFPGGASIVPHTVMLGKTSLKWFPIFGQFFWLSGCVFINRKSPRKAIESMGKVTEMIVKEKTSFWIMPEGTRSKGKGLLPFKKGAFVTAVNAQVPICPVCFSSYSQNHDYSKLKSGKIISTALDPIPTVGMTKEDVPALLEKTHKLMKDAIAEMDKEIAATI